MRRDSRLSWVLHALLHMAHNDRAMTSEEIAGFLRTNAVVVRRELAALRKLGYVQSEKGHGGGWRIACDLKRLTLHDVHQALGAPELVALPLGKTNPRCLVERAVNDALGDARAEAEQVLLRRFKGVTLAQLSQQFNTEYHHHGH